MSLDELKRPFSSVAVQGIGSQDEMHPTHLCIVSLEISREPRGKPTRDAYVERLRGEIAMARALLEEWVLRLDATAKLWPHKDDRSAIPLVHVYANKETIDRLTDPTARPSVVSHANPIAQNYPSALRFAFSTAVNPSKLSISSLSDALPVTGMDL